VSKETYYMAKETYLYGKRGLLALAYLSVLGTPFGGFVCVCVSVKRGLSYGKRDPLHTQQRPIDKCQKRPIIWQKRPITHTTET